MPYITSMERIGIKKGLQQGIQQGLQQGVQQDIQKGGRAGLIEAIEMGLSIKFGAHGLKFLPEIKPVEDINRLEMIKEVI